jgi:hypothetical protein
MSQPEPADLLAIQQLVYRYADAVDRRDSAQLADCFANQVTIIGPGFELPGKGVEVAGQITASLASSYLWTMHNVHNFLYTVDGSQAQGVAYCVASHVYQQGEQTLKLDWYLRYHDELVKIAGQWRIQRRRLEVNYSTTQPVTAVA